MEKFFEKLAQYLLCDYIHNETLCIAFAALAAFLIIIFFRWLLKRWKYYKNAKKLYPYFDYHALKKATRYYIQTRIQETSPTRADEPIRTVSENAIKYFINEVFNEKRNQGKFFIVLGDSGMGKTTFLINLYLRYVSFWNFKRSAHIKLFRFAKIDENNPADEILENIKAVEQKENTILLLDGLDEDSRILPVNSDEPEQQALERRIDEIFSAAKSFKFVVITCRTQYFTRSEKDFYETKIRKPTEDGFYNLYTRYISPFSNEEVKKYLNKRYPFWQFWNRKKRKRAFDIVSKSPSLTVRPMLLDKIDLLLKEPREYNKLVEIYEALVEQWLKREAQKRKYGQEARKHFITNLYNLSLQAADRILANYREKQVMHLTKEEIQQLAKENNIELLPKEMTGESLLTYDMQGNWKFAHKSILEFFIAKNIYNKTPVQEDVFFSGFDMALKFYEELGGYLMVFVKGGTFDMGSNEDEDEKPIHKVSVSDFYIGKYPVTQRLWQAVMGNNPSRFKGCDDCPVEKVSWNDAQEFINKLNELTGKQYRLPTEAEWEYAARGGVKARGRASQYKYAGSNNIDEVAWYYDNSGGKTHPVGQKKPNELGIYDMSGNVWEWCRDWYDENYYKNSPKENPQGPNSGSGRVLRCGSWFSDAPYCRVANRLDYTPVKRFSDVGFRLCRGF